MRRALIHQDHPPRSPHRRHRRFDTAAAIAVGTTETPTTGGRSPMVPIAALRNIILDR